MNDIVDLTVAQIRIYPLDCLPFADLRVPTNNTRIKDSFKFGAVQSDPFGNQVIFSNGLFQYRNKSFSILSLAVQARVIVIQCRAHSVVADAFYSALTKVLNSISERSAASKFDPLVKAEETTCIATLDMDFSDLIAPAFWRFIQSDAKQRLATAYAKPKSISFKNLSFEIKYESDPRLEEYDVAISDKLLTIEPRHGMPQSKRRFFTSSPTDSETHIAVLQALEAEIAGTRARTPEQIGHSPRKPNPETTK